MPTEKTPTMERIVNLAKHRGFIFPSAEIYGGLGGFWDWGPLGVLLKNNIKQQWWKTFVQERDDVVGIDGSIITNPKVWEASGHTKNFVDLLVECKKCHFRYKIPEVADYSAWNADKKFRCENCGGEDFTGAAKFNTMFKTNIGPVENTASAAYLRPETAQNIFANYELVRDTMRLKLPFGIAQIGKAFRNEITPGNFVFRSREFEQMEIEYFVKPGEDDQAFQQWVDASFDWFVSLGLSKEHLRKFEQPPEALAHYSKATTDIEYTFPIEKGWAELMGIANRTDYDLKQHGKTARRDEQAFATAVDDEGKVKKVPYIIEPSMGVERTALALLLDAYVQEKERIVLKLYPCVAPYTVAVFPLLANKPQLVEKAREIYRTLQPHFMTAWDDRGNVGKRYYSQDEIGTPFCVTVDFDTLEGKKRPQGTVTVRDRDSMKQEDVGVGDLVEYFREKLVQGYQRINP